MRDSIIERDTVKIENRTDNIDEVDGNVSNFCVVKSVSFMIEKEYFAEKKLIIGGRAGDSSGWVGSRGRY
jgi:hypothetical protein